MNWRNSQKDTQVVSGVVDDSRLESFNNKCQKLLSNGESKTFLTYAMPYDSVEEALEDIRIWHVFKYVFKERHFESSSDLFNECVKVMLGIRFLRTLSDEKNQGAFRIEAAHPLLFSGMQMEYDAFSGTLKLKTEWTITSDKEELELAVQHLGNLFHSYLASLKRVCAQSKYISLTKDLSKRVVFGGGRALEECLDEMDIAEIDNQLRGLDIEERGHLMRKKKEIFNKYLGREDKWGMKASWFQDEYRRYLVQASNVQEEKRCFSKSFFRDTPVFRIRSWNSLDSMFSSLSRFSAEKIYIDNHKWQEIVDDLGEDIIDESGDVDITRIPDPIYKKMERFLVEILLTTKILLTSKAIKNSNKTYSVVYENHTDIESEWDFGNNAKFEIVVSRNSCKIKTNKLHYNYDKNYFSRLTPGYYDDQYIDVLLESLVHFLILIMIPEHHLFPLTYKTLEQIAKET